MTAAPLPDGSLAGYRLVRKIGAGTRSDVYLGVGTTGTVALKVFSARASKESIGAELDALGRLESPHLVRLLDVSTASNDMPILVLERVSQGSVAALLADRERLECGEVVTLLAPIAALVAQLHGVGVGHGNIGAKSVHLGSEGQPVLLGLGHCALFAPGGTMAAIDTEPAAVADRDALASLALALLERVRIDAGEGHARDLVTWIESAARAYEFPGELAERLFTFAEALPVATSGYRTDSPAVPARLVSADPIVSPGVDAAADPVKRPGSRLTELASGILLDDPIELVKKRVIAMVRGVRPRFWIAAAGVAVGLVLAIALVPSSGSPRSIPAASAVGADSSPVPTVSPLPRGPLVADDPLAAARVLVTARETCFRDLSIVCLDGVDEASSGAFSGDAALIQQIQNGGEMSTSVVGDGATATLTERLGDSALISLGTASILVIRTKVGWRIRDFVTGVQATQTPTAG